MSLRVVGALASMLLAGVLGVGEARLGANAPLRGPLRAPLTLRRAVAVGGPAAAVARRSLVSTLTRRSAPDRALRLRARFAAARPGSHRLHTRPSVSGGEAARAAGEVAPVTSVSDRTAGDPVASGVSAPSQRGAVSATTGRRHPHDRHRNPARPNSSPASTQVGPVSATTTEGAGAPTTTGAATGTTQGGGATGSVGAPEGVAAGGSAGVGSTGKTAAAPAGSSPSPAVTTAGPEAATPATVGNSRQPLGDAGTWHAIFDDEFNAEGLDTSQWSTGWLGSGVTAPTDPLAELACYDPAQVREGGGELDLGLAAQTESCPSWSGSNREPYAGALISTDGDFSYTYGFLEARVWLPATSSGTIADWPGVWADGQLWPQDGEDDLVEGLGGDACWHFHYGPSASAANAPGGCANGTFAGGWHTFGSDWGPGSVTYYYDGKQVGRITEGITGAPMFLVVDLSVGSLGGPAVAPARLRVDYVRVWQH